VESDAGRVHEGAFLKGDVLLHPMDGLHRVDVVLGVGAPELEAVMADPRLRPAVVEAPVVMAFDTVGAVAASFPGLPRHAVADLEEMLRLFPQGNHLPGPFVAGGEGIGRRPVTGQPSVDDLGVRSADGHGTDPAEDLEGTRGRDGNILDLKRAGPGQDKRSHRFGKRRIHGFLL
jgi:hypothetical protein